MVTTEERDLQLKPLKKQILLLGLLLFLTACGDTIAATSTVPPVPTATPLPVTSLTVTAADELNLPPKGAAYLSPDGKLIAWTDGSDLCLYSAAGEKKNCNTIKGSIYQNYLRWSPDSRKVAFTEDVWRRGFDSDIWVLDAASGKPTDLTDDQVSDRLKFGETGSGQLDVAPRWSSDSKKLFFLRYQDVGDVLRPVVHSVAVEGGLVTKLTVLNSEQRLTYQMAISPDGKQVAYISEQQNKYETDRHGIWLADLSGQNPARRLARVAPSLVGDSQPLNYSDLEFSADGRYLLDYSPVVAGYNPPVEASASKIIELSSGTELEIDQAHPALYAAWSSNSTALAYLVHDKTTPNGSGLLYVTDKPGGPGHQIYDTPVSPFNLKERGLDWASNNTLLVFQKGKPVLLHLGYK